MLFLNLFFVKLISNLRQETIATFFCFVRIYLFVIVVLCELDTPRPTWRPTPQPGWTQRHIATWANSPTPKPSSCDEIKYKVGYICRDDMRCNGDYSPCDCDSHDSKNCKVCHDGQGCSQCNDDYFNLQDKSFRCHHCQDTFGDECLHCSSTQGCQQCKIGYRRTYDDICGIWFCVHESCPTPQPTWRPTR